jgi:hypothetical protein
LTGGPLIQKSGVASIAVAKNTATMVEKAEALQEDA